MPGYNPPLSLLISVDDLPPALGFLENGVNTLFSNLRFNNLTSDRSIHTKEVHYKITIVSQERLGFNLGGDEGFALVLNPDFENGDTSEFPLFVSYSWPLLQHVKSFDINSFDFSIEAIYQLALDVGNISEVQLLSRLIDVFYDHRTTDAQVGPYEQFINDFNANNSPGTPIEYNILGSGSEILADILSQLSSNGNDYSIVEIVFNDYLSSDDEFGTVFKKLEELFSHIFGDFTPGNFQKFLIPKFFASLDNLSLALEFPRTWLKPVDAAGNVISDENVKSLLRYNVGSLSFHSEQGFEFRQADDFDLDRSQIGNTGLIIEINELKFDLRTDRNIPEATADGRPNESQLLSKVNCY